MKIKLPEASKTRIILGLSAAIVFSLVLTAISINMYISSGVANLDLSRPGYEQVREQVNTTPSKTFQSNGDVNEESLKEFSELYNQHKELLQASGDFNNQTISDEELRFTPTAPQE